MMKVLESLESDKVREAAEVVLRFGGKIKQQNFAVYLVKDRLRIDYVIEEVKDETD